MHAICTDESGTGLLGRPVISVAIHATMDSFKIIFSSSGS